MQIHTEWEAYRLAKAISHTLWGIY
jgi:hypothetical protein